jgi:L-threonylcarbamoyladenylate synthase
MPRTLVVDPDAIDPAAIAEAAAVIRAGGLVAFPTETVYGLGANALDAEAVRRIYAAKGRPSFNPLIAHVASMEDARMLVAGWPDAAARLAAACWPGPVTLVLEKRDAVPDEVTAGLPRVAVRMPAHPVALALIRAAGVPVAAPSANRFTELSPVTAAHVVKSLGDAVDLVLDGGPTTVGIESAVVDCTSDPPVLLRPGALSPAHLARIVGRPLAAPAAPAREDEPRLAPGMVERHYAPRASLRLFDGDAGSRASADFVATSTANARLRVGALVFTPLTSVSAETTVVMPADPLAYAARLYDALHALDDAGCEVVFVERVPDGVEWEGVRDRLSRAAHQ